MTVRANRHEPRVVAGQLSRIRPNGLSSEPAGPSSEPALCVRLVAIDARQLHPEASPVRLKCRPGIFHGFPVGLEDFVNLPLLRRGWRADGDERLPRVLELGFGIA